MSPLPNDCLSESFPLSIVSLKVSPLSIDCFSHSSPSVPLSIDSPKVTPRQSSLRKWITVDWLYIPKVSPHLLSNKEVRAESVEYEISKRNIPVFKWRSLNLNYIPFDFQLAFVRCFFLFFWVRSVVFNFQMWYLVWQQFASGVFAFCSMGFSDTAGLACVRHPVLYLCTSTSLPAVLLF